MSKLFLTVFVSFFMTTAVYGLSFQEEILGPFVDGTSSESKNQARQAYEDKCFNWKMSSRKMAGSSLESIDCGSVRETGGSNGYRYQSTGTIELEDVTITLEIEENIVGTYVAGTSSESKAQANEFYYKACRRWKRLSFRLAGNNLVFASCGDVKETGGSSGYQYQSKGKVFIKFHTGDNTQNEMIHGGYIAGTSSESKTQAITDYRKKCMRWKRNLIGPNVLFASCGELKEVGGSSGYQYQSEGIIYLLTPVVESQGEIQETIMGEYVDGTSTDSKSAAFAKYQQACNKWKRLAQEMAGGFLIFANCGETEEIGGSSGYQYKSTGTVSLSAAVSDTETKEIIGEYITGTSSESKKTAYQNIKKACREFKQEVSMMYDDDILYATCEDIKEVGGSSGYQYNAVGTIYFTSAL